MPKIEKRLTPEQKEKWVNYCRLRGVSSSEMLGLILDKVTSGEMENDFPGLSETKSEKITIRVSPSEKSAITTMAKSEGYPSRTTWLTNLMLATLHRDPVFTTDEVNALRSSNRELAALGRNLNQIAHAMNIDPRSSNPTHELLQSLMDEITKNRAIAQTLIQKNMNRWRRAND